MAEKVLNNVKLTTAFNIARTRGNISSGQTLGTIMGQIQKNFEDTKEVAYSGSYEDLINTPDIDALDERADELQQKEVGTSLVFNNTSEDMNIEKFVMYGRSVQNGVPTPTEPKEIGSVRNPILTLSGVNILTSSMELNSISSEGGQNIYDSGYSRTKDYSIIKPNTRYYINITADVFEYTNSNSFIKATYVNGNVFTTTATTNKVKICYVGQPNNLVSINEYDDRFNGKYYEPHPIQNATLPYTLRSIGDVKDELIINADGSGKLVQRIGEWVPSGSIEPVTWGQGFYVYYTGVITDIESGFCNKLKYVDSGALYAGNTEGFAYNYRYNQIVFYWNGITAPDVIEKITGAIFTYKLVTPIIHELTAQQIANLKGYAPTTIISNDQNAEMDIELRHTHNDMATYSVSKGDFITLNNTSKGKARVSGFRKNYLNPTLQTTTQNGVTCTRNSDGTFTLNGTSTADTYFNVTEIIKNVFANKKMLSGNINHSYNKEFYIEFLNEDDSFNSSLSDYSSSNGVIIKNNSSKARARIWIKQGEVLNNFIFKPMITDDLNAVYDDYVPNEYVVKSAYCSNYDGMWTNGICHHISNGQVLTNDIRVSEITNKIEVKQGDIITLELKKNIRYICYTLWNDNVFVSGNYSENTNKIVTQSIPSGVNKVLFYIQGLDNENITYKDYVSNIYINNKIGEITVNPNSKAVFVDTFDGQTNVFTDYNANLEIINGENLFGREMLKGMGETVDYVNEKLAQAQALILESGV